MKIVRLHPCWMRELDKLKVGVDMAIDAANKARSQRVLGSETNIA